MRSIFYIYYNKLAHITQLSQKGEPFHFLHLFADRMPTKRVSEDGKARLGKAGVVRNFAVKTHQVLGIKRSLATVR